jgi:hypothetical protein
MREVIQDDMGKENGCFWGIMCIFGNNNNYDNKI